MRGALSRLAAAIRRIGLQEPNSGLEVSLDLDLRQRPLDLEADLVDLFRAIGEAARDAGTGVLLLLDELQTVEPEALEALCAAMHDLSKRELPLAAVMAGLPPLRVQLLDAKTYAERLFGYREIGPLTSEAAAAALVEPARDGDDGLRFEDAALDEILSVCQGYPYFIQVYGHAAWQVAEGPVVGVADAKAAIQIGREDLDRDLYAGRWERASAQAREYIREMAALGSGPVSSGSVASPFGGHRAVAQIRDRLIGDGTIYSPARGQVAFTVPGFADYLRRIDPE